MRAGILTAAIAFAAAGGVLPARSRSRAGNGRHTDQHTTTLTDQADLSVTVYNSDIALVRDVRNLRLPTGSFDLQFMDIAATVNPATVHFRSLTEPAALGVLEQNYEYDLLEPEKLLRKYVGREVTLVRTRQDGGTTREEEVRALLLSYNNGPVWRIGKEIVTGLHRRPHPLSGAAREPAQPPDADLDAAEQRRGRSPRRGVISGGQARLERGLRADRRPRRQDRRPRRLGHADQRQRNGVQQRETSARRR